MEKWEKRRENVKKRGKMGRKSSVFKVTPKRKKNGET